MSRNLTRYVRESRAFGGDHRALRIIEAIAGLKGEETDATRISNSNKVVEWLDKQKVAPDSFLHEEIEKRRQNYPGWEEWERFLVELAWPLATWPGLADVGKNDKENRGGRHLDTVDNQADKLARKLKEKGLFSRIYG